MQITLALSGGLSGDVRVKPPVRTCWATGAAYAPLKI